MLTELHIRNFAIIDELALQFAPGFNVLTGETGAGKSIILDAMSLVLGGRADTTMVRAGHDGAHVEATFVLNPLLQTAITPLLVEEGVEGEDENTLLLARELRANGRNICRINGRTVTLALLRQLGEMLVDIHGQGEHLSLLKPRSHLPLLDAYAGLEGERTAVAREVAALYAVQRELHDLRQNERSLAQRIDLLKFQIEEINAANLKVEEEEELHAEEKRLANVEQLTRQTAESLAMIMSVDDETPGAVDLLGQAERALGQLVRLDESQTPLLDRLQGLVFQLNEVAAELRHYQEQLEFNPSRLDQVEERLALINRLKRKYGDDVETILALRDAAVADLERISHSEERISELAQVEERYLRRIGQMAATLSARRQAAAVTLATAVERELADLQMEGAQFKVGFACEVAADGAFVAEQRLAFDQTGIDRVEFLMSANPGEPPKPLAKVASGGETARLMLALKSVLAQVDATPTLIFDEIDQGIGGRVGNIVGRKLWRLAAVGQHQVTVVTHLPQLAGYGDRHFQVSKRVLNGRTATVVASLDTTGRIQELAAMLGTQGEHAVGGAESILQQVTAVKESDRS
jgi:DNA repair protein RecN (Recombination protein N)